MKSIIDKLGINVESRKEISNSPHVTNSTNTIINQAAGNININESQIPWKTQYNAAKNIEGGFSGFFSNFESLSLQKNKSLINSDTPRMYKNALKKIIDNNLALLNNCDQMPIQRILEQALRSEPFETMMQKDEILQNINGILLKYF